MIHRFGRCIGSIILAIASLILAISIVRGAGSLTRITTASSVGSDWNHSRRSLYPQLSADGTKIAFISDSDLLGQGIITGQFQIWLYDTATLAFTRITTTNFNGFSLSANGEKIAVSRAGEIWLVDTLTVTFTRITTASDINRYSWLPSLNVDGTKIAFASDSDFLGQGIADDQFEVWLYDTAAMTVTRITTASAGNRTSGSSDMTGGLSLSGDSTKIAFVSDSDFLGQGIANDQFEVWLYDTATMTVTRITTASPGDRDCHSPTIGITGTKIAFVSDSDFLGQGIPLDQLEIWLYDTVTMTYTRITTASPSDRFSFAPSMSADETKLAFMSDSDLLSQGIPYRQMEIWLYDIATKALTRVTTAAGSGTRSSEAPSVNTNGTRIAFHSYADFFGQGIPEFQGEIWLYSHPEQELYLPIIMKQSP